jgi:hypothetical protein
MVKEGIEHRVRRQESESRRITVRGARCRVQGEMLTKACIIPCTLYPVPCSSTTDYWILSLRLAERLKLR